MGITIRIYIRTDIEFDIEFEFGIDIYIYNMKAIFKILYQYFHVIF